MMRGNGSLLGLGLVVTITMPVMHVLAQPATPNDSPVTSVRAEIMAGADVQSAHLIYDGDQERLEPLASGGGQVMGTAVSWPEGMAERRDAQLVVTFRNNDMQSIPLRLRRRNPRVTVPVFQSTVNSCWTGHLPTRQSANSIEALRNMSVAARMIAIRDAQEECGSVAGKAVSQIWIREAYRLITHDDNYRLQEDAVTACRRFNCEPQWQITWYLIQDLGVSNRINFELATAAANAQDWEVAASAVEQIIEPITGAETVEDRQLAERALSVQELNLGDLVARQAEYLSLARQSSGNSPN